MTVFNFVQINITSYRYFSYCKTRTNFYRPILFFFKLLVDYYLETNKTLSQYIFNYVWIALLMCCKLTYNVMLHVKLFLPKYSLRRLFHQICVHWNKEGRAKEDSFSMEAPHSHCRV